VGRDFLSAVSNVRVRCASPSSVKLLYKRWEHDSWSLTMYSDAANATQLSYSGTILHVMTQSHAVHFEDVTTTKMVTLLH
jgi:hypothetical protein